jgi:hypothetical protein
VTGRACCFASFNRDDYGDDVDGMTLTEVVAYFKAPIDIAATAYLYHGRPLVMFVRHDPQCLAVILDDGRKFCRRINVEQPGDLTATPVREPGDDPSFEEAIARVELTMTMWTK